MEESLLRYDVRRDLARASLLLAEEFREYGSSGRQFTKVDILELLQTEPEAQIAMKDFQCSWLSEAAALVTYRSIRTEPSGFQREALRSSIWVLRDARWQVLFHQGTKTGGA